MFPSSPIPGKKTTEFHAANLQNCFLGVLLSKQSLNWLSESVMSTEPMGRTLDFFIDLQRLCRAVKVSQLLEANYVEGALERGKFSPFDSVGPQQRTL